MSKTILVMVLVASIAFAEKPIGMSTNDRVAPTAEYSTKEAIGGEHMPLIYSGTATLNGASSTATTIWMHTGWTNPAGVSANARSGIIAANFDPTTFTLLIELDVALSGDSVGLGTARFETAIDTTAPKVWNADESNKFLQDGNADSSYYGQWLFEEIAYDADSTASDTLTYAYPLRVLHPGWIRLVFGAGTDPLDTVTVNWSLICKNGG